MGQDAERAQLTRPHGQGGGRIGFDFAVKPRLSNERGNAILVASSICEAFKYFVLFGKMVFNGRCAIVTSSKPHAADVC